MEKIDEKLKEEAAALGCFDNAYAVGLRYNGKDRMFRNEVILFSASFIVFLIFAILRVTISVEENRTELIVFACLSAVALFALIATIYLRLKAGKTRKLLIATDMQSLFVVTAEGDKIIPLDDVKEFTYRKDFVLSGGTKRRYLSFGIISMELKSGGFVEVGGVKHVENTCKELSGLLKK